MPQIAIPHVIGTALIISLIGVVVLYSNNIQTSLYMDTLSVELDDIAKYVASEITAQYHIVSIGTGDQKIFKILNIPDNVNGKGYSIELVNKSGSLILVVYLDENPNINSSVILPIHNETYLLDPGTVVLVSGYFVTVVDRLYSGAHKPVVVINKVGDSIYIGLGRVEVT